MDIIYKQLKERALKISLTSKCLATKPISNMDKKSIISLICKELLSYRKAFGFEQQCVKNIFKDDHIRQKLNASSIVEIQPTDEAMHKFVENKFIESGEDTLRLLNQVLDGCRDDDKLVCLHQRNLTATRKQNDGRNNDKSASLTRCNIPVGPAVPVSNMSLASESSPLVPVINYASANEGVKKKHSGFDVEVE